MEILVRYLSIYNITMNYWTSSIIIQHLKNDKENYIFVYDRDKQKLSVYSHPKYHIEEDYFYFEKDYIDIKKFQKLSHKDFIIIDLDYMKKIVRDNSLKLLLC